MFFVQETFGEEASAKKSRRAEMDEANRLKQIELQKEQREKECQLQKERIKEGSLTGYA